MWEALQELHKSERVAFLYIDVCEELTNFSSEASSTANAEGEQLDEEEMNAGLQQ